jgi:hypothetical protein
MDHWAVAEQLDGDVIIWRNGERAECPRVAGDFSDRTPWMDRAEAFIGKSNWGHDAIFRGVIEDFRIYRTVLPDAQV